jgi:hypothetical protein
MPITRLSSLALLFASALCRADDAPSLHAALAHAAPTANPQVIELALQATQCHQTQTGTHPMRLAVIDYSLPSTEERLWVFDLAQRRLLFHERVAHGRNSGENMATRFSNEPSSLASSIGLYSTREPYVGRNGYSLRMDGLEAGFNDRAFERDVVIHGADYVSTAFARENGRIGRSHGCPAVPNSVARPLIDVMKDGQLVFIYYPDAQWLKTSTLLHCAPGRATAQP